MADKPPTVKVTQKHPNPARNSVCVGMRLLYVALWQGTKDGLGGFCLGCRQVVRSGTAWQSGVLGDNYTSSKAMHSPS